MPKLSVLRPSSILDFSDEGRLNPDHAFALKLHGCFRRLDLIEILPETDCLTFFETGAYAADIDEIVAAISCEQ